MKRLLTFPHRGAIPPDQPGYTRDRGDPYTFRLNWAPCQLRVIVNTCGGCRDKSEMEFCDYYDKPADPLECLTCGGKTRLPMVIEEGLNMGGSSDVIGH